MNAVLVAGIVFIGALIAGYSTAFFLLDRFFFG
jgi:hypothetical protein